MKIQITSSNSNLNLPIPSCILLNRMAAASLIRKANRKYGCAVDPRLAGKLLNTLKVYRSNHPEWVLVEVQSANGETVRITL